MEHPSEHEDVVSKLLAAADAAIEDVRRNVTDSEAYPEQEVLDRLFRVSDEDPRIGGRPGVRSVALDLFIAAFLSSVTEAEVDADSLASRAWGAFVEGDLDSAAVLADELVEHGLQRDEGQEVYMGRLLRGHVLLSRGDIDGATPRWWTLPPTRLVRLP